MVFGEITPNRFGYLWTATTGRFCYKSRPWFPQLKSTHLRLKFLLLAKVSQRGIHAAACKKIRFNWPMIGPFWMTDFFNRIDQEPTFNVVA
jgi:hypothetical protein